MHKFRIEHKIGEDYIKIGKEKFQSLQPNKKENKRSNKFRKC